MKWTKRHSRNAVAAKAQLRLARAEANLPQPSARVRAPRPRPDFTILLIARTGERVRISATRYGRTFVTGSGFQSARQIARGIEMLLRHLAL